MSAFPEPTAVNRSQRTILFDDGVVRPIASMYGGDGKTDDVEVASVAVVQVLDKWTVIDLRQFEPVSTH